MPRPRPVSQQPERVNIYVRFAPDLKDRLTREADRRRVSLNRLVEWICEDWLTEHEGKGVSYPSRLSDSGPRFTGT